MAVLFGRLPSRWIVDGELSEFGGKAVGDNIAALKILLAISSRIDFYEYTREVSYSDLEVETGLSRPKVADGLEKLIRLGVIEVDRRKRSTVYRIAGQKGWARVPTQLIQDNLRNLPNRGAASLAALKIYLLLLAHRPNHLSAYSMGHDALVYKASIQPINVKRGLDILYSHGLIHIERSEDRSGANIYRILGVSPSR